MTTEDGQPPTEGPQWSDAPEQPLEQPSEQAPNVEEAVDRWRRAVAELDNARKRCAREVAAQRLAERDRVATEWLPVVDSLDGAVESAVRQGESGPITDGLRVVRDQAVAVLASLGYPRFEETAVPYDPYRHEAASVDADADSPTGTVVRVLRPGYGDAERVLRPAAVVVAGPRG